MRTPADRVAGSVGRRYLLHLLATALVVPFVTDVRGQGAALEGWTARVKTLCSYGAEPPPHAALSESFGPRQGGQEPVRVEVDVSGRQDLWLMTDGIPDYNWCQTIWGDPVLHKADGTAVSLLDLEAASVQVGYGQLIRNKSHVGKPLQVGKKVFEAGFWSHGESALHFRLSGQYTRFTALAGIGTEAGSHGKGVFIVASAPDAHIRRKSDARHIRKAFPELTELTDRVLTALNKHPDAAAALRDVLGREAKNLGPLGEDVRRKIAALAADASADELLRILADCVATRRANAELATRLDRLNLPALERVVAFLTEQYPESYGAQGWATQLAELRRGVSDLSARLIAGDPAAMRLLERLDTFRREALLANPILDFSEIAFIRRKGNALGLPANWQSNSMLRKTGYANRILAAEVADADGDARVLYDPPGDVFVGDVDLHFGAGRMLLSESSPDGPWRVVEVDVATGEARQVTPDMGSDVNNYDACYLPDGDILFTSTAAMVAVPCVNGNTPVAHLFRLYRDSGTVRQLCFDQEHSWCPAVMPNGQVMYLRWEYADLPHSNSRILFRMNPDGTGQMAHYGTNSYWPNGVFYARPIPGRANRFVGIVTGHHGLRRMGELALFDVSRGRREAEGAEQRIPGYGQPVTAVVKDRLASDSWPRFLHPYPLGDEQSPGTGSFFLVSCQPGPRDPWGLYLADVFDNMLLLREERGQALLEPLPLRPVAVPPVIPEKVDATRRDAVVFLSDIHRGGGLAGIPRGEVKRLRLFTYTYGYRGMGGLYGTIGLDGPWDARRILGTVPVRDDGSVVFRVPANVPIAVQPLDREGKALQTMRSWFTAMPGEVLSCVGCHEPLDQSPPVMVNAAARVPPAEIEPFHGPARGFSFAREVQPVLNRHCVACHNGTTTHRGTPVMSLRADPMPKPWTSKMKGHAPRTFGGKFTVSYLNLHRYVRHPGIESDMHMLAPMDFHADTTELVQILRRGHFGVRLERAEWDRLITWIDLNTPFHGDWAGIAGEKAVTREQRRADMRRKYAGVDELHLDEEVAPPALPEPIPRVAVPVPPPEPKLDGWPWSADTAASRQTRPPRTVHLGGGISMDFVYIPPGRFVMGASDGHAAVQPPSVVTIERAFWLATTETTNAQFARFDHRHDSRREHKQGYQFGVQGYPLFLPNQPVVRVSWDKARDFCQWFAERTGLPADLPSEAQWEYACRAGTATAFSHRTDAAGLAATGNVADVTLKELAGDPYTQDTPIKDPPEFDDWVPKDVSFSDGELVSAAVASYKPNRWGLYDMHGNVWEWTRSAYVPYPYAENDGRNDPETRVSRTVRGGSWRDRPKRCTSAARVAYRPYQPVFNVGFRVMIPE